uniref:Cft2 n=1 Tax=uncultured bacterium AOCefta2 TaxID=654977 RepID=D6MLX4_9BACT|nr:Cft2 [uncultured bacterium AOCefta2]
MHQWPAKSVNMRIENTSASALPTLREELVQLADDDYQAHNDEDLFYDAAKGDTDAFGELVRRNYGIVYAVGLARLGQRDEAEDLAQEVFLRAFLLLDRLDDPAKFPHWLTRIARNLSVDWQRRGTRAKRLVSMVPMTGLELPASTTDARDAASLSEQNAALQTALDGLAPPQREIILLHYMEGLSHGEIALRLAVARSTVSRQIARAVDAMRGFVDANLKESTAQLRPRKGAAGRTLSILVAVTTLSAKSRNSLAAQANFPIPGNAVPSQEAVQLWNEIKSLFWSGARRLLFKTAMAVGAVGVIVPLGYWYCESPAQAVQNATPQASPGAAPSPGGPKTADLSQRLAEIARRAGGQVGVSVMNIENGDSADFNGDEPRSLYSVFKFPVAVAVLKDVETGKLKLDQKVAVKKSDLSGTAPSSSNRWQNMPVTYTVQQLLEFAMIESDNTAVDKLLTLVGGPSTVTKQIQSLGISGIEMAADSREAAKLADHPNTGSANAIVRLLAGLQKGEVLKPAERTVLWDMMQRATTGVKRLRAGLPARTVLMHKTGTGPNDSGTNDVGIINLPDGKGHLAIAVLINKSTLSSASQEQVIAAIAAAAWDAMTQQ